MFRDYAAMELVSIYLKTKGQYIARQLSFEKVECRLVTCDITDAFTEMYDYSCEVVSMEIKLYEVPFDCS